MKKFLRRANTFLVGIALVVLLLPSHTSAQRQRRKVETGTVARVREEAYRANNLGVALLEQFKHREGAEQFRRALRLDPSLQLARINLAIALYNVPDPDAARSEAERAAALAPRAPQPHYILGLIARSQNRVEDAADAFRRVLALDPRDVGANVHLGQLHAQQRKYAEAITHFRAALEEEPYNGTALYNLGTALLRAGEREEGQRMIERFQELRQSGAATIIGQNYLEQGRYAEGLASTGAEPDLVDRRTPEVVFTDATAAVLPRAAVGWRSKNTLLEKTDGDALLFDYDGDNDLDLLEVASAEQRLYRNDRGKFTNVTAQSGALAKEADGVGFAAVAGDFDNDEKPDLFVLRYGASSLYRNLGGGRFVDVTSSAKIPSYPYLSTSAAFLDYDHDGDLDLFLAGHGDPSNALKFEESIKERPPKSLFTIAIDWPRAPGLLLRNNGDGTFSDQTASAKLNAVSDALAAIPTDYDNRRDVDLLVAADSGVALWRNLRDGTFRDVAREVGLESGKKMLSSVAAGDVNKDGFTDFYFGRAHLAGDFALSDGKGRFQLKPAPVGAPGNKTVFNTASQFIDYDNDGLLDLVSTVTVHGKSDARMELRVWRNTGDGWTDVSHKAARHLRAELTPPDAPRTGAGVLASGDVDGDGDTDILFGVPGGGLKYARNDGGSRNASVRVRLAAKVSNRSGVGAKVEMRAGSLAQKLETYSTSPAPAPSDLLFGLGRRRTADAVRVLWPAGIVQAETEIRAGGVGGNSSTSTAASLTVTEIDRKPSSCPYLYTWNGERFEFVTDFLGGGELGYWVAPGVRAEPDTDEYVRIPGDRLKPRDGRYEIRVTNELEEVLFLDRVQLVAVDHPAGTEVYPNEGLGNPTSSSFNLYTTRDARPPLAATDDHGHDVLPQIARMDRKYPDDFQLHKIRGYAEEHTLTLNLGKDEGRRVKDEKESQTATHSSLITHHSSLILLLTGWTDYAFSSDNVAASHAGHALMPPALQVRDERGEWRTVIKNIGIPVGRPQTVVVDLTGKFLSSSREVRIVTNMRVYWDQILVGTSAGGAPFHLTRLDPHAAVLRWRGFSAEQTPDGREPFGYDYTRVSHLSPWKVMPGRYTREGDVRALLLSVDDMFVIARPGDETAISFDASALPTLRHGWTRTFLLYADGFSKEMDINSASPDQVAPLPFHRMKSYPYTAPEKYPATPAHREYVERYNTRVVTRQK